MNRWYYLLNGQQHGPVTTEQLQALISRGTLRLNDYVWREGMANWAAIQSVPELYQGASPPQAAYPRPGYQAGAYGYRGAGRYVRPHRGAAVLTLGILGLVVCVICGIIAWAMGSSDLAAMRAGVMDRSGEGLTKAGQICGMISVILALCILGFYLIIFLLVATH